MFGAVLLFSLVPLTSFHIIPISPAVHEVYENGEDLNPFLNDGSDIKLFEGDIFIDKGRNAVKDKRYRWKFPIPYILGDDLDLNAKGCVHQAFEMYRLKSCIDFKPYEGEKTFIKFEKRGGCFSSVGDQQTGQILSLGSGCDHKAVIEHELLHALGFYHEQSRTDRDDYVDIWLDQVQPETNGKYVWDNPAKVGEYDPSCDCHKGGSWGWRNFVKHFDLRRSNYLKNGDLIIFIDFEDITPLIQTEVPVKTTE
ncbi:meprin A subunit alpha-like [Festucalex cinctus]